MTSLQRRTVTRKRGYRCDGSEGNSRGCGYIPTFRTYLLPTHCTTVVITWARVPSARCLPCIYTKGQWPPGRLTADSCHPRTVYGAHWHTGRSVRAVCRRSVLSCGFNGWQYLEPNLGYLGPGRLPHPPPLVTGKTLYESAVPHSLLNNCCTFCSLFSSLCTEYTEGQTLCYPICRNSLCLLEIALWTPCETSSSLSVAPHPRYML